MPRFIKFDPLDANSLTELGLNSSAVARIFLGPDDFVQRPIIASPNWASNFIHREYKASEITFRGIAENVMHIPDPISGHLVPHKYTFVPYQHRFRSSVFKIFGISDGIFVLVFAGATGRVTHLILPGSDLVVFDLDQGGAQYSIDIFNNFIKSHSTKLTNPIPTSGRVGIVDMLSNYAHQLMNYLSGVQRLVESNAILNLDEIWISGVEFFGPTENIFPEFADKIKHKLWSDIPSELERRNLEAFKINSNIFTKGLQERIRHLDSMQCPKHPKTCTRYPLIVVTVRGRDRKCANLPEVVGTVIAGLLARHPNLGVILDGFVFPEASILARSNVVTALSGTNVDTLREESDICLRIAAQLPPGVLVDNLVGTSMLQSIFALQCADTYFAHIGTLQHKIAWFTNISGVVHGPRSELSRLETGPYSSETGLPPVLVNRDAVSDIAVESTSNARYSDYTVDDTTDIVNKLDSILSSISSPLIGNL